MVMKNLDFIQILLANIKIGMQDLDSKKDQMKNMETIFRMEMQDHIIGNQLEILILKHLQEMIMIILKSLNLNKSTKTNHHYNKLRSKSIKAHNSTIY